MCRAVTTQYSGSTALHLSKELVPDGQVGKKDEARHNRGQKACNVTGRRTDNLNSEDRTPSRAQAIESTNPAT